MRLQEDYDDDKPASIDEVEDVKLLEVGLVTHILHDWMVANGGKLPGTDHWTFCEVRSGGHFGGFMAKVCHHEKSEGDTPEPNLSEILGRIAKDIQDNGGLPDGVDLGGARAINLNTGEVTDIGADLKGLLGRKN